MKNPIYLDNAASSFPKPKSVAKAVMRAIDTIGGNPGRGGYRQSISLSRIIFDTRMAIAQLLNLPNPERIIFTRNATEGINIALKGILKKGDEVAVSGVEHNAVIRPLNKLKKKGVRWRHAPLCKNGLPDSKLVPKVKMLVTTGASNVTASFANIKALGKACEKQGALLLVDAAQTAGSIPFDASNADIVACTGHKGLLGPQGVGFVWFAKEVEPDTWIEGGTGSDSDNLYMPEYWPDRFEAGTMNTPGIAGLKAGVDYLLKRTVEAVREHEVAMNGLILERFLNDPGITVYPPFDANEKASLVLFNVNGMDPADVGDILDRRGVACRVGLHCSPAAHKFIGTFPDGAVRVSPGALTKMSEVKRFLKIMADIVKRR